MRSLFYVLAVWALLLPTGTAQAGFNLPSFKNKLIELALDQISSPGSFEITVTSIEDGDNGVTSLVDMTIADGDGVWLTLERLNFSWKPDLLLSGELAIDRLELIGLTVSRPPSMDAEPPELKPQEAWSQGLFDWPRAPISLSIDGIRFERVAIAEGVLPQAIRFDAEGRAFDKGDLQELALSLRRTDAIEGRIAAVMRRDFTANTLKLELIASEAAGGMVAAAAGLPANAPARLELRADGPPEDWRLRFNTAIERIFQAEGQATVAYAERLSVDADFTVTPGPELGAEMHAILGDQARLRARVIEQADGLIEVVTGELTSPALTLTAAGSVATGAGASDLAISLNALSPLAELAEGVAFERFTFDGRVTGPKDALTAEGALGLDGLRTAAADAGRLILNGSLSRTAAGLTFDVSGLGDRIRIDRIGPPVIGQATLAAAGALEGDLLTLTGAALAAQALKAGATGTYDLKTRAGNLAIDLAAPEIAPLAAAYGVAAAGSATAGAQITLAGERIDADLSAGLERFVLGPVGAEQLTLAGRVGRDPARLTFDLTGGGNALTLDRIPRDLTRNLDLTARGQLVASALELEILRLVSPLVTVETSGAVELASQTLALDYAVNTAELAPVAQAYGAEAEGVLEANGRAEGTFAEPRIAGEVSVAKAGFDGRSYGQVVLSHDLTLGDAPEGSLSLAAQGGVLDGGEAKTRFRLDGRMLALEDFHARLIGASISGRAGIDLDSKLVDGAYDLAVPDLRPVGRFAGTDISGAAKGQITLTPTDGRQNLIAALKATSLATSDVEAATADLRLGAADVFGTPRLDIKIEAGDVTAENVSLETLRATASGPLGTIDFSAGAEGTIGDRPLAAKLGGRANASGSLAAITLSNVEVAAGPDSLRLRQPLKLRIGGGLVEATGLDLALPADGSLTGDAAMHPGGFTGDLTLTRLSLDILQRWDAAPVSAGLLDAHAVFDTRPGQAGANLTAQARSLDFEKAQAGAGGLDIDLDSHWDGARLDADATVSGDFGDPLRARLALPLRPGRGGMPEVPPRGEIEGSIAWTGQLGDLWALVPAPGHILEGQAVLDLRLAGNIDNRRVSGRADLTGGQYQNMDAGTILTDLTIRTSIADDGTVNVALDGSDGATGKVSARTALHLAGDQPSLDLATRINQATLVRRDDVTAQISGDLAMTGPVSDLSLRGRLEIDKAEVRLVNATPPEVVDLEGIRIKGAPVAEADGNGESVVSLDLVIEAKRNIFARGRGLNSEWKMDLAIAGNTAAPVVTGSIEKVRGQLELLGYPFDLARGTVTFDGGREIDPVIDVALEREADGIRGGILVENRASDPRLRFASTPALPEDEVLPRILFGQSRQSLSPAQAIQLATGVATLLGGGPGPLDILRGAAGLDVLRVEGQSADDASVTIGRNIADGVFIGTRQGLGGQGSAVTVEVDVFDGVVVDTELGQQGGSNIGVTMRKDF
jgi:autotransporter translocation and assembly factor TamB